MTTIDWNDESAREAEIARMVSEQVAGLKAKNAELIQTNKTLGSKARIADEVDVEEYKTLKQQQAELEHQKAVERGEFEKLVGKLKNEHGETLKQREAREAALMAKLTTNLVDKEAISAIAAEEGSAKLLLPHIKSRVRVSEVEGDFRVEVLDTDGLPMEGKGIRDLVNQMKSDADFAGAFRSKAKPLSGAQPSTKTTGADVGNPWMKGNTFNMSSQAQIERTNPSLAAQLKAAAGVK